MTTEDNGLAGSCAALGKQVSHLQRDNRRLRKALQALYDDYKALADSGDAGYWKLEDTEAGKQALRALKVKT